MAETTVYEISNDPDEGLELREAFKLELRYALSTDKPEETISADEVTAKLGLTW